MRGEDKPLISDNPSSDGQEWKTGFLGINASQNTWAESDQDSWRTPTQGQKGEDQNSGS